MDVMKIYYASPIFVQNILTSLKGFDNKRHRYGKAYYSYLAELKNRDYSDYDTLKKLQDERVTELVRYAYDNSPFYKEFYKDVDINSIKSVEDLKKLPVLEKEYVRQNVESMYTILPKEGKLSNTSGTTGKSINFVHTHSDFQKRMAYLDFFKWTHGFENMKMKKATFNAQEIIPINQKNNIFWRDNIPMKQRIYSGYHCNENNLKYYVDNLNKYKPVAVDGYPSSIYEVAKYALNHEITFSFKPVGIFTTAETLLKPYRDVIEKAFRCKVYDQYASSEGAPFVTECECGKMHYCIDTGVIETRENNEMLVTCFDTHGTPLIRYAVGDCLVMSEEKKCDCGNSMPIVSEIEGRTVDYVIKPDGAKLTSVVLSLFSSDFLNSIKRMQYVQNTRDSVDVYIVLDDELYKEDMQLSFKRELDYIFGTEMSVNTHIVDSIPKDRSGKFRFVINNII